MNSVEICNLALDNVEVTNKITSLDAPSKEAAACKRWFAQCRDLVLRSYPWPFATRTAWLAAAQENVMIDVNTGEVVSFDTPTHPTWGKLYAFPADILGPVPTVRRLVPQGSRVTRDPIPFAVVMNAARTGYYLACDQAEAVLEYTGKFDTDALLNLAPPTFVDTVAWKLAEKLVLPLSLEKEMIATARQMYTATVLDAFATETMQQQFDPQPESEFITVRG